MKKYLPRIICTACVAILSFTAYPQGIAISPNGSSPAPSAILDVSATNKGFLMPRLTQGQRDSIVAPDFGLLILNTTTNCINLWLGANWRQLCGDCNFNDPVPGNSGPVCALQTLNLTATSISGATYQWTGPNGFTSNQQNPSIPNATGADSGLYTVVASLNGCSSQPKSTLAVVISVPTAPTVTNNGPLCVGDSLILTASSINGATYTWSGPGAFSASTQNASLGNIQVGDSGIYSVVAAINNGCSAPTGTTDVVVTPIPASTYSPASGQTNVPVSFTTAVSGGTYSWTFSGGSPSSGNTQNPTITWNIAGVDSVTLAVTLNGCSTTTSSSVIITDAAPVAQQFNYTGSEQTWTVPNGIGLVQIQVWGAQGGTNGSNTGGLGGYAAGTLVVTPGEVLYIDIGEEPNSYIGGFNGGGDGVGPYPSGGGGGTDVRVGGDALANRVIIAGGGGGATYAWTVTGGAGGGLTGGTGTSSNGTYRNGQGGTQTAGGAQDSGYPGSGSTDGTLGQGGRGSYDNGQSSGGGGGYYGGGGGEAGGGGGGSGYIGGVTNASMQTGVNSGNGTVTITY